MKLTIRKSEHLDDWFVIERAEHDGTAWFEPIPHGQAFMTSARISDADIEGTKHEMLDIAEAIKDRSSRSHKRCAVRVADSKVELWSPRNSTRHGEITLAEADDLAAQIHTLFDVASGSND